MLSDCGAGHVTMMKAGCPGMLTRHLPKQGQIVGKAHVASIAFKQCQYEESATLSTSSYAHDEDKQAASQGIAAAEATKGAGLLSLPSAATPTPASRPSKTRRAPSRWFTGLPTVGRRALQQEFLVGRFAENGSIRFWRPTLLICFAGLTSD